jgi:hypothetical protein
MGVPFASSSLARFVDMSVFRLWCVVYFNNLSVHYLNLNVNTFCKKDAELLMGCVKYKVKRNLIPVDDNASKSLHFG